MTVNITILGLGQIGTSIGLALAAHTDKIQRTGHDKDFIRANKARELGALDKVELNLPHSVEQADLVILALPMHEIEETLRVIAPDLRQDAVVADTAPLKEPITSWFQTHIGAGRHYVGMIPALNPHHITEMERPPHADLFKDGVVGIVSLAGTPGEAVKLVADLVTLLGAESFFMDLPEADSLMASAHLLPQLLSATLLNMTVDGPGWQEMRRLAGRAYAAVTLPAASQDEPKALARTALANPQASLHVIDSYIQALTTLRNQIAAGDEAKITQLLDDAEDGRRNWWRERAAGDWLKIEMGRTELPKKSNFMGRLFGIGKVK